MVDIWNAASGLGASQADAQREVLVGMGLLSGSSVMVLTALWGACLIVGRCDLVEHPVNKTLVAKDRTLTKGFSLTGAIFFPFNLPTCFGLYFLLFCII